jgi:protein TonB
MQNAVQPRQLASPSPRDTRIALALMASFALHGIALSTQFTLVNPRNFEDLTPPMEVVLVNAKSRQAPLNPEVLAQADLAGGGNVDDDRRAKSPLPYKPHAIEAKEEAAHARVKQLEEQARQLLTQLKNQAMVDAAPQAAPRRNVDSADLMLQASEAAKLQAQISRNWEEYQKRPRREFVGANAKSYVFARYVEDWAAKVEKIGNLNYPDAARRNRIYGSLILTVSILADGRLEKIEVTRPSGKEVLDHAAIRIVELAAPYAPFSKEMREKADIISISRTWKFTSSDQLESYQE